MISSYNEYDPLKRIIVGTATHANWPVLDKVFRQEAANSLWTETAAPSGPVPQWIIDETEEDLSRLCKALTEHGVEVVRPEPLNFQVHDGLYNYCPRDRFIVHGSTIIDPAMMYPCRDMEYQCYIDYLEDADRIIHMPRGQGMVLDAANVLRITQDNWLFLESASGNRAAYDWLCNQLPDVDIELCNFYAGVHIDSTIAALNEDCFVVNGSRIAGIEQLPRHLKGKEVLFVNDVVAQSFHEYPYASKWIALNMLSIDPKTVIIDAKQDQLIAVLEDHFGMTVVPLDLRHSRTLGGGFHCVTLDLHRSK
jgi:glycine amidinotransferase/scyllo-inosamine-4-phosphate amidinotransferase 1